MCQPPPSVQRGQPVQSTRLRHRVCAIPSSHTQHQPNISSLHTGLGERCSCRESAWKSLALIAQDIDFTTSGDLPSSFDTTTLFCSAADNALVPPSNPSMIPTNPRANRHVTMAQLKLRRLEEHNKRLKEDLNRPRAKVSEAGQG